MELAAIYEALHRNPLVAQACAYAAVSHTVNILAQRVKERQQRAGHVVYIVIMSLICFYAGPTLLSLLRGTPVQWLKSADSDTLTVASHILLALFLHPVWVKFAILRVCAVTALLLTRQKLELLFVIIGSTNLTITLLSDPSAYGNWLNAALFSSGALSARVFFTDLENWAWGNSIPIQLTPRTIFVANCIYLWVSQKQNPVIAYLALFAVRFFFGLIISPAHFFSLMEGLLTILFGVHDKQKRPVQIQTLPVAQQEKPAALPVPNKRKNK